MTSTLTTMRRPKLPKGYATTIRLPPFVAAVLTELATQDETTTIDVLRRAILRLGADSLSEETWRRLALENGASDDEHERARHTRGFELGMKSRGSAGADDVRADLTKLALQVSELVKIVSELAGRSVTPKRRSR